MVNIRFLLPILSLLLTACGEGEGEASGAAAPPAAAPVDSLPAALQRARSYADAGAAAQSLALTDSLLQRFPNSLDALLLKAELLTSAGQEEAALPVLEQAYRYAPGDPEVAHQLAFAYAEARDPKAVALADSLIRADAAGTHGEPYYFKGVYAANTGRVAEAIRMFDEAIRHDYNFIDPYMEKGRLQLEGGAPALALATFELAIRVQPTFADAYHWRGRSLEALGRKAEAETDYARAKELERVGR